MWYRMHYILWDPRGRVVDGKYIPLKSGYKGLQRSAKSETKGSRQVLEITNQAREESAKGRLANTFGKWKERHMFECRMLKKVCVEVGPLKD